MLPLRAAFAGAVLALIAGNAALANDLVAQASPSPSPVASPSPSPSASPSPTPKPFTIGGYADSVYTAPLSSNATLRFTNGGNARIFDIYPNALVVQNLNIQLALSGPLFAKAEFSAGSDANIIPSYGQPQNADFNTTYAFAGYTRGLFTLQAGKYGTLAGAEVIENPSNLNISRSYLFGLAIPFTHTGARLTYAPNSHVSLIGGLNQGWDTVNGQNPKKTVEAGIAFNPSGAVSLTTQLYDGVEHITNIPLDPNTGNRILYDTVLTLKPNAKLTLVGNYDYASQKNAPIVDTGGNAVYPAGYGAIARWAGLAGYASYAFSDKWTATLRGEQFRDAGGYRTGFDQRLSSGTLTLAWALGSTILRGELRNDWSDQPVFAYANGTAKKNQSTFAFNWITKF